MSVLKPTSYWGETKMPSKPNHNKTVEWSDEQNNYIIYNVPTIILDDNEHHYTAEVMSKLVVLKELMEEKSVPSKVDFNKISDLNI